MLPVPETGCVGEKPQEHILDHILGVGRGGHPSHGYPQQHIGIGLYHPAKLIFRYGLGHRLISFHP